MYEYVAFLDLYKYFTSLLPDISTRYIAVSKFTVEVKVYFSFLASLKTVNLFWPLFKNCTLVQHLKYMYVGLSSLFIYVSM